VPRSGIAGDCAAEFGWVTILATKGNDSVHRLGGVVQPPAETQAEKITPGTAIRASTTDFRTNRLAGRPVVVATRAERG
jgi:hypothetical protein